MRDHAHLDAVGLTSNASPVVVLSSARARLSDTRHANGQDIGPFAESAALRSIPQSGLPLVLAGETPLPRSGSGKTAYKRPVDIAASALLILLFAPFMLVIAAAIKLSSRGPVFITQEREGLARSRFRMLKFRTTRMDTPDRPGILRIAPSRARLTSVGRLLQAAELDELPQLFNILRGDMSLVGPRPHVPGMQLDNRPCEDAIPYYHARHQVRPGLIGWAQTNGYRGKVTSARAISESIDHDIAYVQNFSLELDFRIIVRTITREFVTSVDS